MIHKLLNSKSYILNPRKGFTLIEIMVTLGVTLVLTSILIVYSRVGERQIILWKDQAKIVGVLLKAKSLALQFRKETGQSMPCGYGVHFAQDNSFVLFKDMAEICSESDNAYSGDSENVENYFLDGSLEFSDLGVSDVLFIPPEPTVAFNPAIGDEAIITLKIKDTSSSAIIKITNAGQITTQSAK